MREQTQALSSRCCGTGPQSTQTADRPGDHGQTNEVNMQAAPPLAGPNNTAPPRGVLCNKVAVDILLSFQFSTFAQLRCVEMALIYCDTKGILVLIRPQ